MDPLNLTFGIHLVSTWYMVGLIWFVQLVHYPLFDGVGDDGFVDYERRHTVNTSWAVGPPMLAEMGTAILLPVLRPELLSSWAFVGACALLVLIWLSTAILQVPMHQKLGAGFETAAHSRLVKTNWIRTVAWTLRGVLVIAIFAEI